MLWPALCGASPRPRRTQLQTGRARHRCRCRCPDQGWGGGRPPGAALSMTAAQAMQPKRRALPWTGN
eukprot:4929944-Alexandrium_andersonii.AAC.1